MEHEIHQATCKPCYTKNKKRIIEESNVTVVDTQVYGKSFNKRCTFPFIFKGHKYYGCAPSATTDGFWCSTKVNLHTREHVPNYWGFCAGDCPMEDCPDCQFPFTYKNRTFWGCTEKDSPGRPWCSIKQLHTSENKYHLNEKPWKPCCSKNQLTQQSYKFDAKCHFPYILNNVQLSGCVLRHNQNQKVWCPLLVDRDMKPIEKHWAICSKECPTAIQNDAPQINV